MVQKPADADRESMEQRLGCNHRRHESRAAAISDCVRSAVVTVTRYLRRCSRRLQAAFNLLKQTRAKARDYIRPRRNERILQCATHSLPKRIRPNVKKSLVSGQCSATK